MQVICRVTLVVTPKYCLCSICCFVHLEYVDIPVPDRTGLYILVHRSYVFILIPLSTFDNSKLIWMGIIQMEIILFSSCRVAYSGNYVMIRLVYWHNRFGKIIVAWQHITISHFIYIFKLISFSNWIILNGIWNHFHTRTSGPPFTNIV